MNMGIYRARRSDRNRKGFTLLELLLVMAILVLLSSLAVVAVLNLRTQTSNDAAATQISTLKSACKMYKLNVGRFPPDLSALVAAPSGLTPQQWRGPYLDEGKVPLDPWGAPFNYQADETTDIVRISSNGVDGQSGTADDIPIQNAK